MLYSETRMAELNEKFHSSNAQAILEWVINNHSRIIVTTHFGPHEAVILHLVSKIQPDLPIVCVDHGYNTDETYLIAEQLTQELKLNVYFYTPNVTRRRREVVYGGVPSIEDTEKHLAFVNEVKLEPFQRAFKAHQPDVWIPSLRKEQTQHRASLDILTQDQRFNCLKVSPLFFWSELDMEEYLVTNDLPFGEEYHDPTKVLADRECGLHVVNN